MFSSSVPVLLVVLEFSVVVAQVASPTLAMRSVLAAFLGPLPWPVHWFTREFFSMVAQLLILNP